MWAPLVLVFGIGLVFGLDSFKVLTMAVLSAAIMVGAMWFASDEILQATIAVATLQAGYFLGLCIGKRGWPTARR